MSRTATREAASAPSVCGAILLPSDPIRNDRKKLCLSLCPDELLREPCSDRIASSHRSLCPLRSNLGKNRRGHSQGHRRSECQLCCGGGGGLAQLPDSRLKLRCLSASFVCAPSLEIMGFIGTLQITCYLSQWHACLMTGACVRKVCGCCFFSVRAAA